MAYTVTDGNGNTHEETDLKYAERRIVTSTQNTHKSAKITDQDGCVIAETIWHKGPSFFGVEIVRMGTSKTSQEDEVEERRRRD